MEWFRQEASYAQDPRHGRLARRLGISKAEARSIVDCLQGHVASYYEIKPLDVPAEELAEICDYHAGSADQLLKALREVGWLEHLGGREHVLVGWEDAQRRFIEQREKWREDKRRERQKKRSHDELSTTDNANVRSDVSVDNRDVHHVPSNHPTNQPPNRTRDEGRAATRFARDRAASLPISEKHYEELLECWSIWQRRVEGTEHLQRGPHPERWTREQLKAAAAGLKLLHGSAGFDSWVDRLLEDDVMSELLTRLDSGSDTIRLATALNPMTINDHSTPQDRRTWVTKDRHG